MDGVFCISFILCLCTLVNGIRFASYMKTSMVQDRCDPSISIRETTATKKIHCSQLCIDEDKCKRFRYCAHNSSCMMYENGRDCVMSTVSPECVCYMKRIGCIDSTCTCPMGFYGNTCQNVLKDCNEGTQSLGYSFTHDVLTFIRPVSSPETFEVLCTFGYGGWTVIHHRHSHCESINFNRSFVEYEQGFGSVASNKWLGLIRMRNILQNGSYKLGVILYKSESATDYCVIHFGNFKIEDKNSNYSLVASGFSAVYSDCGNSLTGDINLHQKPFSTYDIDFTGPNECGKRFGGGWWFDATPNCTDSFPTGTINGSGVDIFWRTYNGGQKPIQILLKVHRR